MTREAVIRGMLAWAEEAVLPQLTPTGMLKVGAKAALQLVRDNPKTAEEILPKLAPAFANVISMAGAFAGDDAAFDNAVAAVKASIDSEPGKVMRWQFMEVGLFNNTPHSLALTSEGIDAIAEKIRAEAAKEMAGVA